MAVICSALSRHRVLAVYLLSLLWLACSAMAFALSSGHSIHNAVMVLALAVGVSLVYALAWSIVSRALPALAAPFQFSKPNQPSQMLRTGLVVLTLTYLVVIITHFAYLGRIPILDAMGSESDVAVSIARQNAYFDLPVYMRYVSDYSIKALGPALLLLTYYFRSRLFWVVLFAGTIYVIGLFARILPVIFFLPLLVYQLTQRRWLHLLAASGLMVALVTGVTTISSVTLRESIRDIQTADAPTADAPTADAPTADAPTADAPTVLQDWRRTSVLYALYERILIVPGQVTDQWFQYYSNPALRENGCGYRLLARLFECEYVHVPSKLYSTYYRENLEKGMRGSLNAASFMTEFANFGPAGFFISALLGGLLFSVVMLVYRNHPLAMPMNIPLVVSSMESNLFTAINSGAGWLIMTLIFIFFFRSSLK